MGFKATADNTAYMLGACVLALCGGIAPFGCNVVYAQNVI